MFVFYICPFYFSFSRPLILAPPPREFVSSTTPASSRLLGLARLHHLVLTPRMTVAGDPTPGLACRWPLGRSRSGLPALPISLPVRLFPVGCCGYFYPEVCFHVGLPNELCALKSAQGKTKKKTVFAFSILAHGLFSSPSFASPISWPFKEKNVLYALNGSRAAFLRSACTNLKWRGYKNQILRIN